jgi:hypothetical protein
MKNLILSTLFLITSTTTMAASNASYMKCTGTDTAGQSVYLITYPNSSTVNINGDMLNIVGKTRNGQGVVTQNFLSVYGVLVYDSLVPVNNNSLTIYQFNAVTETLLAQAWLTCNFYGNAASKASVYDYPMLNAIKPNVLKMTDGMPYSKVTGSDKQDSTLSSASIDACIAKVDNAISASINKAASKGLLCSSADIETRMKLAMSKGSCYGSIDKAQLCKIQLDAMIASSGGCGFSSTYLMNNAKRISGC